MKILIVEDDEQIIEMLTAILSEQNYAVDIATDGAAGWSLVEAFTYDLIMLDVVLPKVDGITFCRQLRQNKIQVPVLLLTARQSSTDKRMGLDAGADDYVVKPFDPQELGARIRALLRRGQITASPILVWGRLCLDPSSHEVQFDQRPLHLTPKEYALLELFLRNPQRVFSRSVLLDQLWSFDEPPGEETVRSHIKGLRQKLKTVGADNLIETLYGQGYRLNPEYEKTSPTPLAAAAIASPTPPISLASSLGTPTTAPPVTAVTPLPTPPPRAASAQQNTLEMVAKIWEKTSRSSLERIAVLEQASAALMQQGRLEPQLHQQALQAAHKLLGSLGTFGLLKGSQLAQQLEQLWESGTWDSQAEKLQIQALVQALRQEVERSLASSATAQPAPSSAASIYQGAMPWLLIWDDDPQLRQQLAAAAEQWKFQPLVAEDLETARKLLRQQRMDGVLLGLSTVGAIADRLTLLAELNTGTALVPVLVLFESQQVLDRVTLARLGTRAFFPKPVQPEQIFTTLQQVLRQASIAKTKILAVDDDPQILLVLQAILEPWGLQVTALENPLQFQTTLEALKPDLLILDVDMPGLSGLELCQSIRNHPEWNWLPVLFLTGQTSPETMYRGFEVGADDYVHKPIVATELVTRILNRLERTRLLKHRAELDPLTGVCHRARSLSHLEQLLHLGQTTQQPVCLAVVEPGQLLEIQKQLGQAIADKVLRQVGQWLRQKLRPEDIVGRWNESTFIIGLFGMTSLDGVEWLAEILESLRQHPMVLSEQESITLSYSAGVAEFPRDSTELMPLYQTADAALHQARLAGGDRVFSLAWPPSTQPKVPYFDLVWGYPESEFSWQVFRALETRGYQVLWLSTPEILLETLVKSPTQLQVSLVCLGDEGMGFDGIEVLKKLGARRLKRSPVFFLSDNADRCDLAGLLGAKDSLLLPCSIFSLVQRLRYVLGS